MVRNRRRTLRGFAAACSVAVVLAGGIPAVASDGGPASATITPPEPEPQRAQGDGRRTLRRLPVNLGRGVLGVVSRDNLGPAVLGGAATAVSSLWDDEARSAVKPGQLDWGSALETAGGPIYSTVFVVGMFGAGRLAHGPRFRAATYDMLAASIVNLGYTEALKAAVGRERPNQQDNKSFPSGHTSNAFALAAVAERHYGWKIGAPAYLVAGLVGVSRLHQDKHWLSDVMAGATLGYVVGRTVVRVNGRALDRSAATTTLSVMPILAREARGLQMSLSF